MLDAMVVTKEFVVLTHCIWLQMFEVSLKCACVFGTTTKGLRTAKIWL